MDLLFEKLGEWNSEWIQTIPYKFLQDDKNAFVGYLKAAMLLPSLDSEPRFAEARELIFSNDLDWMHERQKLALVDAYLAASAEALAALKDAICESDYYRGLPYLGPGTLMPYLSKFRNLADVLSAKAMVLNARGRTAAALDDVLALIKMGKDVGSGESTLEALVGRAIRAHGESCMPHLISSTDDAEICQQLIDAVGRALSEGFAYSTALRSDLDGFVNMASDPEYLESARQRVGDANQRSWLPDFAYHIAQLSDEQVWQELGQSHAVLYEYLEGFDKPYPEFMSEPFPQIDPNWHDFWDTEESYRKQKKAVIKEEAVLGASQILAGLKLCQMQTGVFPDDLEQLVPGYLAALPDDPFSCQAFGYIKEGSGAIIYSVGPDMKDDHAEKKLTRGLGEGDIVFEIR